MYPLALNFLEVIAQNFLFIILILIPEAAEYTEN